MMLLSQATQSRPTSLPSNKIQTVLLTAIFLLIILYNLYGVFWPTRTPSSTVIGKSTPSHSKDDATIVLHPEDHVYRDATTFHLQWNITSGELAPDGVKKQVYFINGQFPGPTIETRSGDELVVEVNNLLDNDEEIGIHWHGLSMRGANGMDGVVGLTQCGIHKGQKYTYRFKIGDDEAGTYWYHAHSGLQRVDGLFGGLVIHKPADATGSTEMSKYDYDQEVLLLIGDWYHRQASEVLEWYTNWVNWGQEPAPDSLLINGHGYFECSMAVPARPVDCHKTTVPLLNFKSRSRVRLVNTGDSPCVRLTLPAMPSTRSWAALALMTSLLPLSTMADTPDFTGYKVGLFVPFQNADNLATTPSLSVMVDDAAYTVGMDTGSTGFCLSAGKLSNVVQDESLWGYEYLSSSSRIWAGYYTTKNVTFTGHLQNYITATVPILAVTNETICPWYNEDTDNGLCPPKPDSYNGTKQYSTNPNPTDVHYMGVGFGREADGQPGAIPAHNPLLNIAFYDGAPIANGTLRVGYVVEKEGIHIGLTPKNTKGFTTVALPGVMSSLQYDWQMPAACIRLNASSPDSVSACGNVLTDTGIPQSFIRIPENLATVQTVRRYDWFKNATRTLLPIGTTVTVSFPSEDNPIYTYEFTIAETMDDSAPTQVYPELPLTGTGSFINTGTHFFRTYDIMFDAEGGMWGMRPST